MNLIFSVHKPHVHFSLCSSQISEFQIINAGGEGRKIFRTTCQAVMVTSWTCGYQTFLTSALILGHSSISIVVFDQIEIVVFHDAVSLFWYWSLLVNFKYVLFTLSSVWSINIRMTICGNFSR